ncbi:MAG: NAD(P)/FAD-dependent oxidoreductase [Candidatus Woesearchaeota archaeon]|nr:NAD(P)/FAD-dependent oxidoreductase [Candidatus Woesearchaeota archaeon]
MRTYEVVIIGAGPAGFFSALYLSENLPQVSGKVLLIDKSSHIGGMGARTDGKLNLTTEIGMELPELRIKKEYAEKLISYIDSQFNQFEELDLLGTDKEKVSFWEEKLKGAGLTLIPARQRHMGTDRAYRIMNNFRELLIKKEVSLMLGKEVIDIVKKKDGFLVVFEDEEINCKYIIAAPGRTGAYWFRSIANKLGIEWTYGNIDIGLRIEIDSKIMKEITDIIYDPKIRYVTSSHGDKVRTFCTNPNGYIAIEDYKEFKIVNGHALNTKKSENTNFAILQTIGLHAPFVDTTEYGKNIAMNVNLLGGNKPILQRLGDLLRGRRTKLERFYDYGNLEPTIAYGNGSQEISGAVTLGDISMIYSKRILDNLMEFLNKLDSVFPGVYHPQTLIYAPEIKFYDIKYSTTTLLETNIENIFVAGDGCGKSRGIVGAALTGILAATGIISKFKKVDFSEIEYGAESKQQKL